MVPLVIPGALENFKRIRKFKENIDKQKQLYSEALEELEEKGEESLQDRITSRMFLPPIGRRHIEICENNGHYHNVEEDIDLNS